jgi:hypothetical protein
MIIYSGVVLAPAVSEEQFVKHAAWNPQDSGFDSRDHP